MVFERGYVYVPTIDGNVLPDNWTTVNLPNENGILSYHPSNRFGLQFKDNTWIALIGLCMDTVDYSMNNEEIIKRLLNELDKSELEFWNRLDWLNGRFVVFYSRGGQSMSSTMHVDSDRSITPRTE